MSRSGQLIAAAAVVVVLGVVWWATREAHGPEERTFRTSLVQVDTSQLQAFTIVPAPQRMHPNLEFQRTTTGWVVTSAGYSTPVDTTAFIKLLAALRDVRIDRMAGKRSVLATAYGLADSTADRIVLDLPEGRTTLLVGVVGGSGAPSTAVAMPESDEIYTTPGDLGLLTDKSFPDWVPKPMVNGDPANWRSITFLFPGNTGYVMQREGTRWSINGVPTDSAKTAKYLRNLSRYSGGMLADPNDTLQAVPAYGLIVDDRTRDKPVQLGIFAVGDRFIARSTLAPSSIVMQFDREVELPRMFRSPAAFMP